MEVDTSYYTINASDFDGQRPICHTYVDLDLDNALEIALDFRDQGYKKVTVREDGRIILAYDNH